MKRFKRISAVCIAIVLVSALGCAGGPMQESTGDHVTDSWITTNVKAALVDDPAGRLRKEIQNECTRLLTK